MLPYTSAGGGGSGYGGAGAAAYKVGGMGDPKGYAAGGGNGKLVQGGIPLPPEGSPSGGNSRSWFSYEELQAATNGFAVENLLGEGGFGRVYKGELSTGQVVAVKQLTLGGGQGDREFRAEVDIISRVHHRHLVSLVGYCIADKQRLLVYDFVPNGTLDVNLYGRGKPVMTWEMRVRVALGAARGLAYLHEDCHPRIIHRDIKSSNILLDAKYEAQVADFGLAKLASDTNTHVSTRVMGTFGYLAPEYAQSGKLTEKSDVYSFGVVLLELITGSKPIDQRNPVGQESLVEWTRPLINYALDDGDVDELMDPRLDGDYDPKEALKILEVAASCVRHTASKRPKMGQVVRALESEDINNIHQGLRPGHSSEHESDFDTYGGDYDTQAYNADMMRSMKSGATNKPYGSSSEYSNEYPSGPRTGGQYNVRLGGGGGSSSEFEPIMPKSSESTRTREPGPISVRTGRFSMPKSRPISTESYTSLPPVRAAPPRPDLISDESGSMASDIFIPPPSPPNFSAEYSPIDFSAAKSLRDGR